MKYQNGFSLIEILLALFISSIILSMLIQFYVNNRNQYLKAQKQLSQQFEVQWVGELMANSIRRAGFTPCINVDRLEGVDRRTLGNMVQAVVVNNQSIQINRMEDDFIPLKAMKGASVLLLTKPLNTKFPIIIADCQHVEINEIETIERLAQGFVVTLSKPLWFTYDDTAYVGSWLEERWFIKKNAFGKPSLYYHLFQTEELSPYIHALKVHEGHLKNKRFFEVALSLENENDYKMLTAVRGS